MFQIRRAHIGFLAVLPLLIGLFNVFGPFLTDTVYLYSNAGTISRGGALPGRATIDPNIASTSFALGARAADDVTSGLLPLWNPYEGLGTPLLGEMQSAALFPPTWLLLLPHGQALEHAFLQFIGGLGAFLFFRRFGLGVAAALAGALLYELNGVFAWLRNAIFNPVAFLPWFLLTVETARVNAGAGWRERFPAICLGAIAAALAVYAGFPETVYLYCLFVAGWTLFRMYPLSPRDRLHMGGDLLATAVLGTALSAPVLVAFLGFLPDSYVGRHGQGFSGIYLHPATLLQYLTPYVYGPIFAVTHPVVMSVWSGTGGYVGFLPVVLAIAALLTPGQRGAKAVLAAWIVICIAVTQGVPGIHQAFMAIPGVGLTAAARYLNVGWIFCTIFLAAMFLDAFAMKRASRAALMGGIAGALALVGAAVWVTWPLLPELWPHQPATRFMRWTGEMLVILVLLAGAAVWLRRRADGALAAIAVMEATVCFCLPFFSLPRTGEVDLVSIKYLRDNIGLQRVVEINGQGISTNFGSFFKIATLNYDDIPVPVAAVDYIRTHLDPYAENIFVWSVPDVTPEQQEARLALLRERLPAYARAGVKYLLADANFNARPRPKIIEAALVYPALLAREPVETSFIAAEPTLAGVTAIFAAHAPDADGRIQMTACAKGRCVSAETAVSPLRNRQPWLFEFPQVLPVAVGEPVTVRIERLDGEGNIAVAMANERGEVRPVLGLIASRAQLPVYSGPSMSIYEIPEPRPYFSAPGCMVRPLSRNRADIDCPGAATLIRLELFMRGWSARVNGVAAPVGQEEGAFQAVELPAGRSVVTFTYRPPGFDLARMAALAALVAMLAGFFVSSRSRA